MAAFFCGKNCIFMGELRRKLMRFVSYCTRFGHVFFLVFLPYYLSELHGFFMVFCYLL